MVAEVSGGISVVAMAASAVPVLTPIAAPIAVGTRALALGAAGAHLAAESIMVAAKPTAANKSNLEWDASETLAGSLLQSAARSRGAAVGIYAGFVGLTHLFDTARHQPGRP